MDAHSHNLLEPHYQIGDNAYHYDALRSDETGTQRYFKINYTRDVTPSGIVINITSIVGGTTEPTAQDIVFLTNEINNLVGSPINGNECEALGWTFLGTTDTDQINIDNAIAAATAAGYSFKSIFYQAGYFVHGCADTKQFYDQRTA